MRRRAGAHPRVDGGGHARTNPKTTATPKTKLGRLHRRLDTTKRKQSENENCSNRTLFGDYGALIEGTILGLDLPLRTLMMAHFDREGGLTEVDHVVINGVPPVAEEEWRPATGTYTVNPDCTGSAVINTGNPPIPLHFVVVNRGKEFRGVVDGNAITVTASRVD